MVLQKIIFKIFLDNKDIVFVLFVLNIIYRVLRRDQLYHKLGLSIISNFFAISNLLGPSPIRLCGGQSRQSDIRSRKREREGIFFH